MIVGEESFINFNITRTSTKAYGFFCWIVSQPFQQKMTGTIRLYPELELITCIIL
jgi:hypothetical protein